MSERWLARTILVAVGVSAASAISYLSGFLESPTDPHGTAGAAQHSHVGYLRFDPRSRVQHVDAAPPAEDHSVGNLGDGVRRRLMVELTGPDGRPAAGCTVLCVPEPLVYPAVPRLLTRGAVSVRTTSEGVAEFDVPVGHYTLAATGDPGHEWRDVATVTDVAGSVVVRGSLCPSRTFTMTAGGVGTACRVRIAGPHPDLYWDVESTDGRAVLGVPARRDTMGFVLDRSEQCVGVFRVPVGRVDAHVDCGPAGATQVPAEGSWFSVFHLEEAGSLVPICVLPGIQDPGASGTCVAVCAGWTPFVVGSGTPRQTVPTPVRAFVNVQEPGDQRYWSNADVRVDLPVALRGTSVLLAVDQAWTDGQGTCEVHVPTSGGHSVQVMHPRIAVASADVSTRAWSFFGKPCRHDTWFVGKPAHPVVSLLRTQGRVVRRADEFGTLWSPAVPCDSVVVSDLPQATPPLEYLALGEDLVPWDATQPPAVGTCAVTFAGRGEVPDAIAICARGMAETTARLLNVPLHERTAVLPPIPAGPRVLVASPADAAVAAVLPMSMRGVAGTQVIRFDVPTGGIWAGDFRNDAELLVFSEDEGRVALLWRSGIPRDANLLLLPTGRYLVQIQDTTGILARVAVAVKPTAVDALKSAPIPSYFLDVRVRVAQGATAPGVDVLLHDETESVPFVVPADHAGRAMIAWPLRTVRASSWYGKRAGPTVTVSQPGPGETVVAYVPLQEGS